MNDEVQQAEDLEENIRTILQENLSRLSERNPAVSEIIRQAVEDGWFEHHQT